MDLYDLRQSVELALEIIENDATVVAAEVCASWCEQQTVRVAHDADRPTDSVQAPQSSITFGIGILVVIEDQAGRRVGVGSDGDDISQEAIILALEKAKANAVTDADFKTLPAPPTSHPTSPDRHDPNVIALQHDTMTRLGTEALNGALSTLREADHFSALQISGEIRSRTEHLMVGNTNGLLAGETTTGLLATIQCHLTSGQSQGTGSCSATHLNDFTAYDAGAEAAEQALRTLGGTTLAAGTYAVVFGPAAVAALFEDLILPALSLDTVAAGSSPFATHVGHQIANPLLTVTDDGSLPGLLGSHAITGEGLPTGAMTLIDAGRLVGFLTDTYHAQKLAAQVGPIAPRNGRRVATNGQSFAMRPGIFPTNVTVASSEAETLEALLEPLAEGIYVDSLWYTYPQAGLHSGAFTSTVIGSSFHIREGKLNQPLQPGTLHLNDNFLDLLQRITGLSTTQHVVASPTMQSVVLAPEIRCSHAHFTS